MARGTTRNTQRRPVSERTLIVGARGQDRDNLEWLALMTADAIEAAVEAALAGDRTMARRVLHRGAARRAAKLAAEYCVRQQLALHPPRTGILPAVAAKLQLIAELGHIGDLAGVLARQTSRGENPSHLPYDVRRDVATVGHVGAGRIRRLAEGLPRPEMDAEYRRAGCELRVVADHLGGWSPGASFPTRPGPVTVVATCAAAAEAVLLCSRFASRAA